MIRIGIDVGGTNTDAVLIAGATVRHAVKTVTTPDVSTGIVTALRQLLAESGAESGVEPGRIDAVMIGTTHFTNAVVQRRHRPHLCQACSFQELLRVERGVPFGEANIDPTRPSAVQKGTGLATTPATTIPVEFVRNSRRVCVPVFFLIVMVFPVMPCRERFGPNIPRAQAESTLTANQAAKLYPPRFFRLI